MLKVIMAVNELDDGRFLIGNGNKLPWYIKEELQYFKKTTIDSIILYGYNTAKSLDFKPLPSRHNIILCDTDRFKNDDPIYDSDLSTMDYTGFKRFIENNIGGDIFICGGAQVYDFVFREYPDLIDEVYISYINKEEVFIDIDSKLSYLTPSVFKYLDEKMYWNLVENNPRFTSFKWSKRY